MNTGRNFLVYLALAAALVLVVIWQGLEHRRVERIEREALVNSARDITSAMGLILRSGTPGFIFQNQLEMALKAQVAETDELISVALLNADGETVVAAGEPFKVPPAQQARQDPRWDSDRVTIVNPVDFGAWHGQDGPSQPVIILNPDNFDRNNRDREPRDGNGPGGPGDAPPDDRGPDSNRDRNRDRSDNNRDRSDNEPNQEDRNRYEVKFTSGTVTITADAEAIDRLRWLERSLNNRRRNMDPSPRDRNRGPGGGGSGGAFFRRPPWMSDSEFQELLNRQGLHAFVLVLSNSETRRAIAQDFWLRLIIVMMSSFAVIGGAFAWFNRGRSARLQLRLLRAQEMNLHLREMNIAAAGLAHETRNPLNIVRGLAQMIAKNDALGAREKESAISIAVEVDRVTTRLNEFINYSRPVEPKWGAVQLHLIVEEVNRALTSDREDQQIEFEVEGPDLTVRADEALLRQVLFNLILNAIQALDEGGMIRVRISQVQMNEAMLEVLDDGPGVAPELCEDIFRPYFTGHEQGTGLGLAVVRQIVLAHHWDIEYVHNNPKGANFRISGMQIVRNA